MFSITLFIAIVSASEVQLFDLGVKNSENYGPYTSEFAIVEQCKGPKSRNATDTNIIMKLVDNAYLAYFNLTVLEQTHIGEVKIVVYNLKDDHKTVLWNYRVPDPCQHFAIAKTVEKELGSVNCIVKKGQYYFELNHTEYCKTFFGSSFFYGEFQLKVVVTSSKGNFVCFILNAFIKKIKNNQQ